MCAYCIDNMNTKTFKNPHLSSWNDELFKNIKVKNEEIREMSGDIGQLEELNASKKSDLLSLEKTMENTLNNVEKYMEQYSNNVRRKLEEIKENKYENTSDRSKALFSLYKDLYQDARMFFSRREFKYEPSLLKLDINDRILSWLTSLFEEENSDGWADILTPIWSIEHQYIDMETKYKILTNSFENATKNYEEKKKVYDKLSNEVEKMKKELEALKEFSEKIKECCNDSEEKGDKLKEDNEENNEMNDGLA